MSEQSYSKRFQEQNVVENYESVEYSVDSYSSYIWQLQMPVIADIICRYKPQLEPTRLLDFACGTGRILSFLKNYVDQIEGVDISPLMAQVAQQKCPDIPISVGDILSNPTLATGDFHIISAFRFLLNTEPTVRVNILKELRKRLINKNGVLVANIHGNRASVRSLAIRYRKMAKGESHAEMSRDEVYQLMYTCGYEVLEEFGFGVVPPTLYRTPLKNLAQWFDRTSQKTQFATRFSIDLLYVCRPRI